jgi:hypothetical protein
MELTDNSKGSIGKVEKHRDALLECFFHYLQYQCNIAIGMRYVHNVFVTIHRLVESLFLLYLSNFM